MFRLGISFQKKSVKLYSDFYKADIIIASPLGLRTITGTKEDKKRDYDFLSSIEMVILDSSETLLMQNVEHLETLFSSMNLFPERTRETDFSRLKTVYADGKAKYLRQTIIFSEINSVLLQKIFLRSSHNSKKLKVERTDRTIAISKVTSGTIKQVFYQINWNKIETAADDMFVHFCDEVLPELVSSKKTGICIYVASYFDFIRLRNYLEKKKKASLAHLCEYTPDPDITRDRSDFYHEKASIILYTERLHFYKRLFLKGIKHIIFYGLPSISKTYHEMINQIDIRDRENATCISLYNKMEWVKLERIVGKKRSKKMIKSEKKMYMFY